MGRPGGETPGAYDVRTMPSAEFVAAHYPWLRHLHITCVVLSITLFLLRGGLGLCGVDWRQRWPALR